MNTTIAVASDDQLTLAPHFGRTKGFLIYDIEDGKIKNKLYLENTFTGHANGKSHHEGSGHHKHGQQHSHAGILNALRTCRVIISSGMGRKMLIDFENKGKEVFITSAVTADMAVELYLKGQLVHMPDRSCQH